MVVSFPNAPFGAQDRDLVELDEGDIDLPGADPVVAGGGMMSRSEYAEAFRSGFHGTVRFLRSRGASEDSAEEVAQAAWTRGWERLYQLRNPEAAAVWVASIAKHLWRSRVVREQRHLELDDAVAITQPSETEIPWDEIVRPCTPDERRLLALHYIDGFSSSEIAENLGCSALAVRLRLMRVRRKLDQKVSTDLHCLQTA